MTRVRPHTVVDENRDLRPEFGPYLRMMDFLAELLGPRTEIVLHDVSDPSYSIVALTNGQISGRSVGGPATDLALKVLQDRGRPGDADYLANYAAESSSGRRFRSSTFFIRDEDQNVVGLLCVNVDDEPLLKARELLEALTATSPVSPVSERLSPSVEDLTLESISRIVAAPGVPAERLTADEKLGVVRELDHAGLFLLKGAVARAAQALQVSEPTLYRYLKQVRQS